jgi:hypothetical protein
MTLPFKAPPGRPVSLATGLRLSQIFWPEFKEIEGCIFAVLRRGGRPITVPSEDKTGTECLINHTHILDVFRNNAEIPKKRGHVSENLDDIGEFYNEKHPDFFAACEIGRTIAQMWALKLKFDFPDDRFRVYFTQYDNPIVRFHKVRPNEPVWLTDEAVQKRSDSSWNDRLRYGAPGRTDHK